MKLKICSLIVVLLYNHCLLHQLAASAKLNKNVRNLLYNKVITIKKKSNDLSPSSAKIDCETFEVYLRKKESNHKFKKN